MLVQYSVKNYKSIKDEIIINFSAYDEYKNSGWTVNDDSIPVPLYKCICLIGPNASGKTNIIESVIFASRYILNTIKRKDSEKINIKPFAFAGKENTPSSFEFIFYNNGTKYIYGFSINKEEVLEEYLMECFSEEPETLFDRSAGQHYEFYNHDFFDLLLPLQNDALKRARLLHISQEKVHETVYSHECNPYTDIFRFIDYIEGLKKEK